MEESTERDKVELEAQTPQIAGTEVQEKGADERGEPESQTLPAAEAPAVSEPLIQEPVKPAIAPATETASAEPLQEPIPLTGEAATAPETRPPETVDPAQAAPLGVDPPAPAAVPDIPSVEAPVPETAAPAPPPPAEPVAKPDVVQEPTTEDPPAPVSEVKAEASPVPTEVAKAEEIKEEKPATTAAGTQEGAASQGPASTEPELLALKQKVDELEGDVEDAKQKAHTAIGQSTALAIASGTAYTPPLQVPPEMVPAAQPPPVDLNKLEQQSAQVNVDVQRRRELVLQQQQLLQSRQQQELQAAQQRRVVQTGYEDEPSSPQERAMPPRRAASARAAQNFKRDADDYLSESPADSPADSPRAQKKPVAPKPKPPTPPAPKPTQSKDSGADAWEEPPQKQLVLKPTDITKALQKKWLQLYWPDDGKWWPCQVVFVDPRKKTANVLYETGEEEADLELANLVQKGEVAWLNPSDAKPEVQQRPKAAYGRDDFEDPTSSRGRGKKQYSDEEDEEEDDDEEGWAPGRKRRAAKGRAAKYEEESEPESSESESPPLSEQSSDWHSSEDDDKPTKRRPKKKKKVTRPAPRAAQPSHHHQHHQHQQRERPGMGGGIGRGGIFDDTPGFGGSFGGSEAMRMQQQRNQGMGQAWGGMGAPNRGQAQHPGNWNRQPQGLDHILQQNRQQMNTGNMGQIHIPQVSMQNNQMLEMSRYQQAQAAAQGMRGGQMGWRPQAGPDLMRTGDWAQQMQGNPLFRLQQQMGQHGGQMGHQQAGSNLSQLPPLVQQQMLQQQQQMQRLAQQQQQNQQGGGQGGDSSGGQRSVANLGNSTRNMEGIVAQGLNVAGKKVEVQQANGQWTKGTIMAVMARGPQGGSALVHFENGEQKQLSVNEEGRTYNIKLAA